jgi:hypothetical protein
MLVFIPAFDTVKKEHFQIQHCEVSLGGLGERAEIYTYICIKVYIYTDIYSYRLYMDDFISCTCVHIYIYIFIYYYSSKMCYS